MEDGECLPVVSPVINGTIETGDGCTGEGHEWTNWLNSDNSDGAGDFEYIHSFSSSEACENPTAIRAASTGAGGDWPVHIDLSMGFWCVNSEQGGGVCADFKVQMCCPKMATGSCDEPGYSWSDWQDQDDPTESGDWELR